MTTETIYLKDYTVPEYLIDKTDLHFDLSADDTVVTTRLDIYKNSAYQGTDKQPPLTLNGEELSLISIAVDGIALSTEQYTIDKSTLIIHQPKDSFVLEICNRINPAANTALNGLYMSNGMLCTQCEAEGFRHITWFPDRPDVMSTFTVSLEADKTLYPILLSNGNRVDSGELENNRHWAKWHDPFPKPSYLFALVAGDLACIKDRFTTCSGRDIALEIYVEAHDIDKCQHAMQSLINSMRWDEQAFGREYDLDIYMIVAVSHFNMGAMENKGLNVFNTKFVLASDKIATDMDYENIEAVIGHEYFHNWSGNRVTCRDWFQLSLKEGFTVFRDQQFTADQTSASVKRILDVKMLRSHQFAEDAGPLAHPIRPSSYMEINNFYTLTVYEKGAEVVRMLHTLIGAEGFRAGTDLYFDRHDGQAATTDDFIKALEDANNIDLSQFKNWYTQAGTPVINAQTHYDAARQVFTLNLEQSCPDTPGQTDKKPYLMPIKFGLIGQSGKPIKLEGEQQTVILEFNQAKQSFCFEGISEQATPSILRGFSAPVKLKQNLSFKEQLHLYQYDSDSFNRWEAGQNCLSQVIFEIIEAIQNKQQIPALDNQLITVFESILTTTNKVDFAYLTLLVSLPDKAYLATQMQIMDVDAVCSAHKHLKQALAMALKPFWEQHYLALHKVDAGKSNKDIGERSFKNICLDYLMATESKTSIQLAEEQYNKAQNMTDQLAALTQLSHLDTNQSKPYLSAFYKQWQQEDLVIDKWFSLQACSSHKDVLGQVKALSQHTDFDIKKPNRVRSLIAAFANNNLQYFNAIDGSGYQFVTDYIIKLDALNPQIAARLAGTLSQWRKFDEVRQQLIKSQLERIKSSKTISKNLLEVVLKSLGKSE